jgi:myosin heavy subunit
MLVRSEHWSPDTKKLCSVILDTSIKVPDKYQVGITKIFFRAGMVSLNNKFLIACFKLNKQIIYFYL